MIKSFDFTHEERKPERKPERDPNDRPPSIAERLIAEALELKVEDLTRDQTLAARKIVEQAMYYLDEAISSIKNQIDIAHNDAAVSGKYSDRDWYRRVNAAQRFKGRQRQQLQNKFGEINRRLRQQNLVVSSTEEVSRNKMFVKIAGRHLKPETFARLWELVDSAMNHSLDDELSE